MLPSTEQDTHLPWSQDWYDQQVKLLGEAACQSLGFYVIPNDLLLSVVIPVYNEQATLEELVERVKKVPIRKEIILIDDGSKDDSLNICHRISEETTNDDINRVVVLAHEENAGKGASLKSGFMQSTGDIVIVQDADLEYDPVEFLTLIKPIVEDKADVVFGSRFLGNHAHRVLYFWHYLGNQFLTNLSNCFTNLNLTDMETCYKVFRGPAIREIAPTLQQKRFGIEPEMTAKVARKKHRIYEIAISYSGRTYAEGKKIGWKDGVQAIWCIIKYGVFA